MVSEKLMAIAFNDDGDFSCEEMSNARNELLRRLKTGDRAINKITEIDRLGVIATLGNLYKYSKRVADIIKAD